MTAGRFCAQGVVAVGQDAPGVDEGNQPGFEAGVVLALEGNGIVVDTLDDGVDEAGHRLGVGSKIDQDGDHQGQQNRDEEDAAQDAAKKGAERIEVFDFWIGPEAGQGDVEQEEAQGQADGARE